MAFDRILVPTDGSEFTRSAIRTAIDLAKISGGRIVAMYVIDQTLFVNAPMDSAISSVYSILKKEGNDAVGFVREEGEKQGVKVDTLVLDGSPVKTIVENSGEYDLIVMGTLGRTGMSKLLMGSVAEKVVRHSKCPVMIARSEGDKK